MEQTSFFEALYTPCIHSNGSYTTISIHRTKEGAEKSIELAMAKAKEDEYYIENEFEEYCISEIVLQD